MNKHPKTDKLIITTFTTMCMLVLVLHRHRDSVVSDKTKTSSTSVVSQVVLPSLRLAEVEPELNNASVRFQTQSADFTIVYTSTDQIFSLRVIGSRLYVGKNNGVGIYDVSNPGSPLELGELASSMPVLAIDVKEDVLFAASVGGELRFVDISNEQVPTTIWSGNLGTSYPVSLKAYDHYLALGDRWFDELEIPAGLNIIDITDMQDPVVVSTLSSGELDIADVSVMGGELVVSMNDAQSGVGTVNIVDVSDAIHPFFKASYGKGGAIGGFSVSGGAIYAASYSPNEGAGTASLDRVDFTNISEPIKAGGYTYPSTESMAATASVDAKRDNPIVEAVVASGDMVYSVEKHYIIECMGCHEYWAGVLRKIDFSNPNAPVSLLDGVIGGELFSDMEVSGDYVFLAAGEGGVHIYRGD